MRVSYKWVLPALTVVLVVGGGVLRLAVPDREQSPSGGQFTGYVNQVDDEGQRVWTGQPIAETNALGNFASELQEEYPDVFVGAALTSDYQALEVYVTSLDGPGISRLREAAAKYPGRLVLIQNQHSLQDLLEASVFLTEQQWKQWAIVGSTPDFVRDSLEITVDEEALGRPIDDLLEDDIQKFLREKGSSVDVRVISGVADEAV